jgi:hypothetical protein
MVTKRTPTIDSGGKLLDKFIPDRLVSKWQPNTAYTAGQPVVSPAGDMVTAVANFTSGASFNAANWNISSSYDRAGQAAALSIVFGG